jgi:hypothetical protein
VERRDFDAPPLQQLFNNKESKKNRKLKGLKEKDLSCLKKKEK